MKIIVWADKHDTSYYDATTIEAWDASSIEILKELTGPYGYIYETDLDTIWISEKDKELIEVDLDTLPEPARKALEKDVTAAKSRVERERKYWARQNEQRRLALEYIEAGKSPIVTLGAGTRWEKQVPSAWLIIEERNGAEYEDFRLEDVFTIHEYETAEEADQ